MNQQCGQMNCWRPRALRPPRYGLRGHCRLPNAGRSGGMLARSRTDIPVPHATP
jgi:hypothetical protein